MKKSAALLAGLILIIAVLAVGVLLRIESEPSVSSKGVEVVASRLAVPWSTAELPDGTILVTERGGTLKYIADDRTTIPISGVVQTSEGGLLGLALHPSFKDNRWLYLYLTTQEGEGLTNRVERYKFSDGQLTDRKVIIENIPGAAIHDGGALGFGPDGLLYITTGDAGNEPSAQDQNALSGKILRLKDDGGIPQDNPFGSTVYSYGHRNSQGIAWDDAGRMWSVEHGRSGIRSGFDEINLIKKGANYGWPEIEGDESRPGMEMPVRHSGATTTWAPSGLAYADGVLYFAGLRGKSLYEAKLDGTRVSGLNRHFEGEFGRLRGVTATNDNSLLVTTSNRDGRGSPAEIDDRILRVPTARLQKRP